MPYQLYDNIGKGLGYKINSTVDASSLGTNTTWKGMVAYVAVIAIIALVILILIHYTLYPIFILQPGDPGIIPVPGFANNEVYWKPSKSVTTFTDLSDVATSIQTNTMNYSVSIDIAIQNPYISTNGYSVIFSRGGTINPNPPANSSIIGTINNYNLAIALAPGNTDLIVSVLNSDGNPENVLIPNIPIQTPFRISAVIMSTAFEVYLNGKLVKTRTYASGNPGNYTGPFHPPAGTVAQAVRVGNLLLWNRLATPSNIRYAKPTLMPAVQKDTGNVSITCNSISTDFGDFDALMNNASQTTSAATANLGPTAVTAKGAITDLSTVV